MQLKRSTSKRREKSQNVTELNATLTPQRGWEELQWLMHGTLRSSDGGVESVTRHNALFTWKVSLARPTVGRLQAVLHHPMLRFVTIHIRNSAVFWGARQGMGGMRWSWHSFLSSRFSGVENNIWQSVQKFLAWYRRSEANWADKTPKNGLGTSSSGSRPG